MARDVQTETDWERLGRYARVVVKHTADPRMRRELLAHLDATGGDDLLPIVKAALVKHRASLEPAVHSAS